MYKHSLVSTTNNIMASMFGVESMISTMEKMRPVVFLNQVHSMLRGDRHEAADGLDLLFDWLRKLRIGMTFSDWVAFVTNTVRKHPVFNEVQKDPLTNRCYEKPRGYAGDAVLIDYIYAVEDGIEELGLPEVPPGVGQWIYSHISLKPAASAVRCRRKIIAKEIYKLSVSKKQAQVFSIACGHLREANKTDTFKTNRLGRYLALDSDSLSLEEIKKAPYSDQIECIKGSVKDILAGKVAPTGLDLVYAAGLYDYLSDRMATVLTAKMFEMLKPGGKLLVANYLPNIDAVGYMEACMDWWLIYRDEEQMHAIARSLAQERITDTKVFTEPNRNVVFLEVEKR
ncbi:MAG: hypothetical protein GY847_29715 [Proteobacteria bacterium]|nr:hypothetical protein [Pseudomonadota bacterium]